MYIKTDEINNDCDYLTAGKVYRATNYGCGLCSIQFVDGSGTLISTNRKSTITNSYWYECDEHGNKLESIDPYHSNTEQVTITLSKADKDALERILEELKRCKPAMPNYEICHGGEMQVIGGLTKREQFAMAAMQGLCTGCNSDGEWSHDAELVASVAVKYADALLKELEK